MYTCFYICKLRSDWWFFCFLTCTWLDFFFFPGDFGLIFPSIQVYYYLEIWSICIKVSHLSQWIKYCLEVLDERSVWSINWKLLGIVSHPDTNLPNCVIIQFIFFHLIHRISWETFRYLTEIWIFLVFCIFLIFQSGKPTKKENELNPMRLFLSQPIVLIISFFCICLQTIILTINSEFLPDIDWKFSDFQNTNIFPFQKLKLQFFHFQFQYFGVCFVFNYSWYVFPSSRTIPQGKLSLIRK